MALSIEPASRELLLSFIDFVADTRTEINSVMGYFYWPIMAQLAGENGYPTKLMVAGSETKLPIIQSASVPVAWGQDDSPRYFTALPEGLGGTVKWLMGRDASVPIESKINIEEWLVIPCGRGGLVLFRGM